MPVPDPRATPTPAPSRAGVGRALTRFLLLLTALLALTVGGAGQASAHAVLENSDPRADSVLPVAPASVTLRFSESVEIGLGGVKVLGPDGQRADRNRAGHGPEGDSAVVVPLRGGLQAGTYTVVWRVVSADSHPIAGAFVFSIGHVSGRVDPAALEDGDPGITDELESAAAGLSLLSFALLGGSVFLLLIARPAAIGRFRSWLLLCGSWGGLLIGSITVLFLHGPNASGLGLSSAFDTEVLRATLDTRLGQAIAARVVLLGVVGAVLGWMVAALPRASGRTRRVLAPLWVVLYAALAVTWPIADHASVGRQVPVAVTADVLHMVAMAGWIGGLALALLLLERPGDAASDTLLDVTAMARFSRVAVVCVSVLVATGLYATWRQVGSFGALFGTDFGLLLTAKTALVVLMLVSAWFARRLVTAGTGPTAPDGNTHPGRWSPLRRLVAVEVALAVAVLGVTTVLTGTEPARTAHEREQAEAAGPAVRTVAFDAGGAAGRGNLDLTLDPARVGANELHLYFSDPGGALREVEELTVTIALPGKGVDGVPVNVRREGPGHWYGELSVPMSGRWEIAFTIRTSDIDRTTVKVPVEVR